MSLFSDIVRVANAAEKIAAYLAAIAWQNQLIAQRLNELVFVSKRPGQLTMIETGQIQRNNAMPSVIKFKIVLPPVLDADVVSRQLTVTVGDGAPVVEPITDLSQAVSAEYSGEQDIAGTAVLVDLDDAGNPSEPSVLDFVLKDTFPPAKPGELGIVETGEEVTPLPTPE